MKTHLLLIILALFTGVNCNTQSTSSIPAYLIAYMQLKDALHLNDVARSKAAAAEMKNEIRDAGIVDKKKLESINLSLTTIVSSDGIEAQRTAFAELSKYMITILKDNPVKVVTLYSDFCEMALNGKGAYWISTDKEINNNPYTDVKMARCGTMDEKISK